MMNEHPLVRRFRNFVDLTPEEEGRLRGLGGDRACVKPARRDLICEGERPRTVFLILSGWAGRYKQLPDGRRQLLQLLVPGDLCDIHNDVMERMDHTIAAVTELRYVEIPHRTIGELEGETPNLQRAFRWHAMTSISVQREWTMSMGQRSASERIGALLCELFLRLRAVGLTDGPACDLPLTQTDLAEATGLTSVHVNRTLQEMRAAGLIRLEQRRLTIPDLGALAARALFSPDYLHLRRQPSDGPNAVGALR